MADLVWASLTELAKLIATKEVSPVEVVRAHLDRIAVLDDRLRAYITVCDASALDAARAAESSLSAGGPHGPLHGVPIALKDLFQTAAVRTTAGSKILGDAVPDTDATVVKRLRAAGAVILGKLNMHEFAYGPEGLNDHYGHARNPWDGAEARIAGGSSSGSGVAVAAALAPGALGSDTGGSIRIPAALCGVTGLKPTYGRVSRAGVLPLSWSMDHAGPMARTAADCALMLGVMAGYDPDDGTTSVLPVPPYLAALNGEVKGDDRRALGPDPLHAPVQPLRTSGVLRAVRIQRHRAAPGYAIRGSAVRRDDSAARGRCLPAPDRLAHPSPCGRLTSHDRFHA
jgi:aspartyl-tRNA(Asn)/glutamyl-tRNA(Gln) amidotransferase subunit A